MEDDSYACPPEFNHHGQSASPSREPCLPFANKTAAQSQLEELGRTVAAMQEFIEMEQVRRQEREQRQCEEARCVQEEARKAEEEHAARKAEKQWKHKEEQMGMAKAVEVQVAVRSPILTTRGYSGGDAYRRFKNLMPAKSVVTREAQRLVVDAAELVPGDLVLLCDGDRVPADIRLVTAVDLKENTEREWVEAVKRYQGEESGREENQVQKNYVRRRRKGQGSSVQGKEKEAKGTDESMGEGGAEPETGENEELPSPVVGDKRKHTEGQTDRESVEEEQEQDREEGYPWEGLQERELRDYINFFEKERDDNYELQLILHREEKRNKTKAEIANPTMHIPLTENPFAPLEKEEDLATYFAEKYCASKEDQEMEVGEGDEEGEEKKNKKLKGRRLQKYKPTPILEEQGKGKDQEGADKFLSSIAHLGIQLRALEAQNAHLVDLNREMSLRTVTVRDIQCSDQDKLWERARMEASTLLHSRAVIPIRRDPLAKQWKVAVHEDLSIPRWQRGQKREDLLKKISKGGEAVFMGLAGEQPKEGGGVLGEAQVREEGKEQTQFDARPLLICLDHKAELQNGLRWKPWWWLTEVTVTALGSDAMMTQNAVALATLLDSQVMAQEAEELPTLLSPFEGEPKISSSS
ncbi:hypothetical protein CBR_g37759 [Chara braunii]|uniref:P-type ATPase A domain-containing protein n=1 Tax=Chara braunii TaxID=69332 RepID=A0A388LNP9_CHABU|nr:hypothetical protein CBR_g37759 [Chara braunii]|eukprot:GBG83889.1 hypothetical protein CBR_g37759 [Chara braunii]